MKIKFNGNNVKEQIKDLRFWDYFELDYNINRDIYWNMERYVTNIMLSVSENIHDNLKETL